MAFTLLCKCLSSSRQKKKRLLLIINNLICTSHGYGEVGNTMLFEQRPQRERCPVKHTTNCMYSQLQVCGSIDLFILPNLVSHYKALNKQ